MSRNRHNAPQPAKQGTTAWAKLNRSPLNKTRIAPRSPLSVSITERASLPSINTTATSPGVIHFHERVFDARLHFYERLFRDSRTFMSEFEMNRPRLTIAPVKCSQHLTHSRPLNARSIEQAPKDARPNAQPPSSQESTRSARIEMIFVVHCRENRRGRPAPPSQNLLNATSI